MIEDYRELDLWNKAHAVVLDVYRLTNPFPRNEQFGITSQLRRAAYSIPSNIAEGFKRHSTRELIQFLGIAHGSLEELRYFILLSRDLRYLSPIDVQKFEQDLKAVAQMIAALLKSLRARLNAPDTNHGSRVTSSLGAAR